MTVLDLGSGAGDVALELADIPGPQGRVVGVDMDEAILETAERRVQSVRWSTVTFRRGDVRQLEFDDEFDAVVGRCVLMYVKDPVALLSSTAQRRRPGGIVAFQEGDLSDPLRPYPPVPLHAQVARWTHSPSRRTGP